MMAARGCAGEPHGATAAAAMLSTRMTSPDARPYGLASLRTGSNSIRSPELSANAATFRW